MITRKQSSLFVGALILCSTHVQHASGPDIAALIAVAAGGILIGAGGTELYYKKSVIPLIENKNVMNQLALAEVINNNLKLQKEVDEQAAIARGQKIKQRQDQVNYIESRLHHKSHTLEARHAELTEHINILTTILGSESGSLPEKCVSQAQFLLPKLENELITVTNNPKFKEERDQRHKTELLVAQIATQNAKTEELKARTEHTRTKQLALSGIESQLVTLEKKIATAFENQQKENQGFAQENKANFEQIITTHKQLPAILKALDNKIQEHSKQTTAHTQHVLKLQKQVNESVKEISNVRLALEQSMLAPADQGEGEQQIEGGEGEQPGAPDLHMQPGATA